MARGGKYTYGIYLIHVMFVLGLSTIWQRMGKLSLPHFAVMITIVALVWLISILTVKTLRLIPYGWVKTIVTENTIIKGEGVNEKRWISASPPTHLI